MNNNFNQFMSQPMQPGNMSQQQSYNFNIPQQQFATNQPLGMPQVQIMPNQQFPQQNIPNMQFSSVNYPQQQLSQPPTLSMEKPKLRVQLKNQEKGYYSSLLTRLDPQDSSKVKAKDAVTFFKKSGLPVDILKKIWVLASSNNDSLDREEFYVALKLISYAQNNVPVCAESILGKVESPLPKFQLEEPKKIVSPEEELMEQQQQQQAQPFSQPLQQQPQIPSQQPIIQPMIAPIQQIQQQPIVQQTMQNMTLNNFSNFQIDMTAPITSSPQQNISNKQVPEIQQPLQQQQQQLVIQQSNTTTANNIYHMEQEAYSKFEQFFIKEDQNLSGFVDGGQARELFLKSNLTKDQLKQIWKLTDVNKRGKLSRNEFIVALHLIRLCKIHGNSAIPEELPENLKQIIVLDYFPTNLQQQQQKQIQSVPIQQIQSMQPVQQQPPQIQTQLPKADINLLGDTPIKVQQEPNKYDAFNVMETNVPQKLAFNPEIPKENIAIQNQNVVSTQNVITNTQATNNDLRKASDSVEINETKNLLMQQQKELVLSLGQIRQEHSELLKEKKDELAFLKGMIQSYTTLNKKVQDENKFLKNEMQKIEDSKKEAKKQIADLYEQLIKSMDQQGQQISNHIVNKAKESINEIGTYTQGILKSNAPATNSYDNQNYSEHDPYNQHSQNQNAYQQNNHDPYQDYNQDYNHEQQYVPQQQQHYDYGTDHYENNQAVIKEENVNEYDNHNYHQSNTQQQQHYEPDPYSYENQQHSTQQQKQQQPATQNQHEDDNYDIMAGVGYNNQQQSNIKVNNNQFSNDINQDFHSGGGQQQFNAEGGGAGEQFHDNFQHNFSFNEQDHNQQNQQQQQNNQNFNYDNDWNNFNNVQNNDKQKQDYDYNSFKNTDFTF